MDSVSAVKCTEPLPLEAYFTVIQAHFQARQRIAELNAQLNDVAHQYRMVEKRLLVRFKDRNPTPLGGLESLMRETYTKLLAISECDCFDISCCAVCAVLSVLWYCSLQCYRGLALFSCDSLQLLALKRSVTVADCGGRDLSINLVPS